MLSISHLRPLLHRLVDVICDEAESNAAFGQKVLAALDAQQEPVVAKTSTDKKKPPAIDPFAVLTSHGPHELRTRLQKLDLAELRAIVRAHRLDPSRLSDRWKTQERFIDLIVERVEARSKQGDTFRQYASRAERVDTVQTGAETTGSPAENASERPVSADSPPDAAKRENARS